jgi:hypothetical protein
MDPMCQVLKAYDRPQGATPAYTASPAVPDADNPRHTPTPRVLPFTPRSRAGHPGGTPPR